MKALKLRWLLLLSMLPLARASAISMVYNFRIAQITKQVIVENQITRHYMPLALLFDQYQRKYNGDSQNFIGGLGSFIFDFRPYYMRIDGALSHIHATNNNKTTFSGTESDDILFTIGRNFNPNHQNKITLSGLAGIPTHPVYRLKHVDFGYGQAAIGVQLDGSYALNEQLFFLWGTRYIYFIPRSAHDDECNKYRFSIGNIGDLLVAQKNNWGKHGLEYGYTARFDFGARVFPAFDDIVNKTNYIRNSFYAVYKYKFLIGDLLNRLLLNISYGFDSTPKKYGNKYIIMIWGSWSINF